MISSQLAAELEPVRLLVIAGSLREASYNRRLAQLACKLANSHPAVESFEWQELASIEPYNGDQEDEQDGFPTGAARLARAVRSSDGLFIATPEYNGSVPGQLKNALDWLSRSDTGQSSGDLQKSPLFGVPVAVASASTGQFGALWARDELVKVLRTQGARPLADPSVTLAQVHDAFADDGELNSPEQHEKLSQLVTTLISTVRALRAARARTAAL